MKRAVTDGRTGPDRRFLSSVAAAIGLAAAVIAPAAAFPTPLLLDNYFSAPSRDANPALWEVRDGDTTIYLFGTFHTLDARTLWFDRSVRAAFDRSGELVLETIAPTAAADVHAAGRLAAGPRPAPDGFLAATRSVVARGRAEGLSVERGADNVLRRAAVDQGMSLSGIELFADQLRTFARISASPQVAPMAPVKATPPVTLPTLLAAWKAGDTRAFAIMLAGFEARAPLAYRLLISDRNALYGEWIEQRLERPGTVFVAVGSGHLAGKDSVQNLLLAKGIEARRIG